MLGRHVLFGCTAAGDVAGFDFLVLHSEGFVQIALPESVCDRLIIPEAVPSFRNERSATHGQCVAVDAVAGTTTGISAADRAQTARMLASPTSVPDDFTRPGHLVPVRVHPSALATRSTVAGAALGYAIAALPQSPGAVFAELVADIDPMRGSTGADAADFADTHGLPLLQLD
ncbi:3,4-dihydroxy-2-butanone-4-phosphate synthase [Gordonia terrae]